MPALLVIPKGTPAARHAACGETVYWVDVPIAGKIRHVRMPLDTNADGGSEPDRLSDGAGVNHLAICHELN